MIDDTPPVCVNYRVRDGTHRLLDSDFQYNTASVVAQWRGALFDLEVTCVCVSVRVVVL